MTTRKPEDGGEDDRDIAAERDELEKFRGDVMAGCDIERGGKLYRQVEVVIGPGITVEGRQRAEEAKRT